MGGKVSDSFCVPLCHSAHNDIHNYGRSIWEHWGVSPLKVIHDLHEEWKELTGSYPPAQFDGKVL